MFQMNLIRVTIVIISLFVNPAIGDGDQRADLNRQAPPANENAQADELPVKPRLHIVPSDQGKAAAEKLSPQLLISESPECMTDVQRICPEPARGSNFHTLSCLSNRADDSGLSPECHTYIWQYKLKMSEDDKFNPMINDVCSLDMTSISGKGLCGKVDSEKGMVPCLVMHKNDIQEAKCKTFIEKLSIIVFSDYRLIGEYYQACKDDVGHLNCGSADEDESASHTQGSVIGCLEKNYKRVSVQCKAEIRKVAELQANDFNLDRALYFACKDDRSLLCGSIAAGEGKVFECLMEHKQDPKMSPECTSALGSRANLMIEDVKINYGIREFCLDDLQRFKGECDYEEDDNEHSQMARMLLCLEFKQRSGKPLTSQCVTQMKSVRKMLMSDYELSPSIVAGCANEIQTNCDGMQKEGKTLHCLMKMGRAGELQQNERCFNAIEFLIRAVNPIEDASTDTVLMEACGSIIRSSCKDKKTGALDEDLIGCLNEKMGTPVMTETCADVLLEISYFAVRDWALDRKLYRACKEDAKARCNAPEFGSKKDQAPNGETFACLYRHINHENKQTRLSRQCTAEVLRVMKERAVEVGLNPHIESLCRPEIANFCSDEKTVGDGEELQCLQDLYQVDAVNEEKQLSVLCAQAIKNYTEVETEEVQINRKLYMSCQPMIDKYCQEEKAEDVNQGALFKCMVKHKNEPDVQEICQAGIEHMQIIQLKDFAFDAEFKKQCRLDVTNECGNAKTKDQVVSCLSQKVRDAKVQEREITISAGCQDALKNALQERYEDIKLDPEFYKVCREDMKSHCQGVKTGQGRMLECLKTHREELTEQCHNKVFQREKVEFNEPSATADFKLNRRCRNMIIKYCSDEEDVFSCLKKHRTEPDFDEGCTKMVESRMEIQGEDIRLNPQLLLKCGSDVKQHCDDVIQKFNSADFKTKPEEYKGDIINCLREKYVEKVLSDQCADEVRQFMRQSAQEFKMDFRLKHRCEEVIQSHCSGIPDNRVEECLKEAFLNKKIEGDDDKTIKCKHEIGRILNEGHSDIQADPILQKTCSRDVLTLCPGVKAGRGRQVGCLVNAFKTDGETLTGDCRRIIRERLQMWDQAGAFISDVESFSQLMTTISTSTNRHYFLMIFAVIVSCIFIGGLLFGRITKRVHREMKSR
jgi:Golgi apparatus protein 1